MNRVRREGGPRKMRPSFNRLDETRRANQSDLREAALSARNVFDVARFTVYNKTPNYWLSASYKQPGLVWRKGRGGSVWWCKNTKPSKSTTRRSDISDVRTMGGEKESPLNRMMGADG